MLILFFQHVFEYFTERTPQSHFERRETSLVWNYKYAGIDFFKPSNQKKEIGLLNPISPGDSFLNK